jgi:sugar-specific transcriptional regulator TrmB
MNKRLESLGLKRKDYSTYRALLQLGSVSIREISARTRINRGTTHEILKKLVDKNLVSLHLKGKRKQYLAQPPEKLLEIAREKSLSLSSLEKYLKEELIPELNRKKVSYSEPTARYFEGEEGVEKVLKDLLSTMRNKQEKLYFAYSALPIRKYLYRLFPNFTKQRIRNNIKVKVIALGEGGEEAKLAERKWLPVKNSLSFSSYILIYADKYAIISLAKDELPYGVIIEESGIAHTQKLIFSTLWNLL